MMSLKINIVTLGCSKNLVDSEYLGGCLKKVGYDVAFDSDKTAFDSVIINTCGFIDAAKEEAIDTILAYCEQKKQGSIKSVIVCGCLIQLYAKELRQEIAEVDAFFGTAQWNEILQYLNQTLPQPTETSRLLSTPKHYAYLKISEGCDRSCSFCSIPIIRGKNISRPIEDLVKEAAELAKQGVKELILIAQDTTYYGLDIYHKRRLADLIKALAKIENIVWIRIQYAYPNQFPMEILDLMKAEPKLCKYIDMPLQHINTEILQSMQRMISGEQTKDLVMKIKEEVPDIAFRTTFIVGYCGETKEQFEQLKDFVRQMSFDRLGAFKYSPQEGTAAYLLKDSVSEKEKERRLDELTALQQEISLAKNIEKIGQVFTIIIDSQEGDYWVGRSEFDSPEVDNEVLVSNRYDLSIGSFVKVKIIDAVEFDLIAEVI
ncbi:MAG: 30S ribosomal protein S12 methylthiotransferase RimO [Bacteroidales bacterium]|jgi:ribosomal protein S12 methylthiotransferase|nr:30S ribosomal protein S12 methylthiotransferase RimO [Bacteroidales bacterium]